MHGPHGGAGGETGRLGNSIGMTMAVLGVLLALCSAMVGGARTKIVTTMVEQTNTSLKYQSLATKYRMLQAQLQQLHALSPSDPSAFARAETEVETLEQHLRADREKADIAAAIHAVALESKNILMTVTPTREDVLRFAALIRKFDKEKEAAKEWSESYEDAIDAHTEASEHFEWGQLAAEIGIVIASIGLMLHSRKAWFASIGLAVASLALVGWTFVNTQHALTAAQKKIADRRAAYAAVAHEDDEQAGDEKLLHDIEGNTETAHAE